MPSYNEENFIDKCLESVVNQTFESIEIICVDAGSSDGTLDVIERYADEDSRVKLIHSDIKSYGHQMNLGMSQAIGEYIGIVETDDYIDEKMYESLYDLTFGGTADIAKVNFFHLYSDDPNDFRYRIDSSKKDLPKEKFQLSNNLNFIKGHPCIWAAIYKKSFLEENNIKFIEEPGAGWVDNPFLFETAICADSIAYSEKPYYYYRELNPDSSSNDLKDVKVTMTRLLDVFDILEKYSCTGDDYMSVFYIRIFSHLRALMTKYGGDEREDVLPYVRQVLHKMKEEIVLSDFGREDQKLYYRYLSPLRASGDAEISAEDFKYVKNENDFLYSHIDELEDENKSLILKNKNLSKEISLIKSSKAYKLGSVIAWPIRKIRQFFN